MASNACTKNPKQKHNMLSKYDQNIYWFVGQMLN